MAKREMKTKYKFYDGKIDRKKDLKWGGFFCFGPFGLYRKIIPVYPFAHTFSPREFMEQYKVILDDKIIEPGCYLLDTEIVEEVDKISGIQCYKVIDRFGEILSKEEFLAKYDVKNDMEGKIIFDYQTGEPVEYK
jgi:hypothetical protein